MEALSPTLIISKILRSLNSFIFGESDTCGYVREPHVGSLYREFKSHAHTIGIPAYCIQEVSECVISEYPKGFK